MKTKTIELKTIDEIDAETKKKVLDKHREYNAEGDWYTDNVTQPWEEKLKAMGFEEPEIFFNGFGSQGDGACFTAENIDLFRFASTFVYDVAMIATLKRIIGEYEVTAIINDKPSHYVHEMTKSFEVEAERSLKTKDAEFLEMIRMNGEKVRQNLCKQIYKDLQEWYDGITSDEELEDYFSNNETYFNMDTLEIEHDA